MLCHRYILCSFVTSLVVPWPISIHAQGIRRPSSLSNNMLRDASDSITSSFAPSTRLTMVLTTFHALFLIQRTSLCLLYHLRHGSHVWNELVAFLRQTCTDIELYFNCKVIVCVGKGAEVGEYIWGIWLEKDGQRSIQSYPCMICFPPNKANTGKVTHYCLFSNASRMFLCSATYYIENVSYKPCRKMIHGLLVSYTK